MAEGLSNLTFKNESILKIESKNISLFIQSDKLLYKSGEKLHFRVLILDSFLRPAKLNSNSLLNIEIMDPELNLIKQMKNLQPKNGVVSSELQFAEKPIFGDWTIVATVDDERKVKKVLLSEYIPSKFSVEIDSKTHFSSKDDKICAIVRAKYTNGIPVKGHAIVRMKEPQNFFFGDIDDIDSGNFVTKTIPINGKANVEFDIQIDLKLDFHGYSQPRVFEIMAIVIEDSTERNYSTKKEIMVHDKQFKLVTLDRKHDFIPGEILQFDVKLSHHDNSPIIYNNETKRILVGKIIDRYELNEHIEYIETEMNENGVIRVHVTTGTMEKNFYLILKYMNEESDIGYFYAKPYTEPPEFQMIVLTKRPSLRQKIFVEVESKVPITRFTYQLIAHGKILLAKRVSVPKRKYHVFSFVADFNMVPTATLIAYYFKNDDIISTKTKLTLKSEFNNDIQLKLSEMQVNPGGNVTIHIDSMPYSFIGLVAVDSSLFFKNNLDRMKAEAFREMDEYQNHFLPQFRGTWYVGKRPYEEQFWNDFHRSNVILFTNAKQESHISNTGQQREEDDIDLIEAEIVTSSPSIDKIDSTSYNILDSHLRIISEFSDTWLWESIEANDFNGSVSLTRQVPQSINSWSIYAFTLNSEYGFGLMESPALLKIFQPFFISFDLPHSVKQNEIVIVSVTVFNFLNTNVNGELILYNDNNEFELIIDEEKHDEKRFINVPTGTGTTETFKIRFNISGTISIKVNATSLLAADSVIQIIHVEPEGIQIHKSKAFLLDLRNEDTFNVIYNLEIPNKIVSNSLRISFNAIGNIFEKSIKNLNKLIRLPTGCGEQNMLKLVANIITLDHLRIMNDRQTEIEEKAVRFINTGYQKQLAFRHLDGSFSSFGRLDSKGSVWLTAFVLKSFNQASKYIEMDISVTNHAKAWVLLEQKSDGSFQDDRLASHQAIQSIGESKIALTSYIAIALYSNSSKFDDGIEKALNYISNELNLTENLYDIAIAAYALQLTGHPKKDDALNMLLSKSQFENNVIWWNYKNNSKTINVEITAYGLLALIEADRLEIGLPVFRWLISELNDRGGFESSQDTIVGLEALAKYAQHLSSPIQDLNIKVTTSENKNSIDLNINLENSSVLQNFELASASNSISFVANGNGVALLQIAYVYNLMKNEAHQSFLIRPMVEIVSSGHIIVHVCAMYL